MSLLRRRLVEVDVRSLLWRTSPFAFEHALAAVNPL